MKFDNEMIWNIVLIVSVILIINGLSHSGDKDKKAAQAGQNTATLGAIGLASTGFAKTTLLGVGPAIWKVIAWPLAALTAFFTNKVGNIVSPAPSVPSWIWIGGFLILALLIFRKGK